MICNRSLLHQVACDIRVRWRKASLPAMHAYSFAFVSCLLRFAAADSPPLVDVSLAAADAPAELTSAIAARDAARETLESTSSASYVRAFYD